MQSDLSPTPSEWLKAHQWN